jgi:uracil-DNA glycosylase
MDADQESRANPFGMDEECTNCPALCETRGRVVHGYGDVGADFGFVGSEPGERADRTGIPFDDERVIFEILDAVGFLDGDPAGEWADTDAAPDLDNVFLTQLARCHHPERAATDDEVRNCEPYLNSELRMINPEIIVPVGQRALEELAFEYTTKKAADLDVAELHATTVRGRGFELIPMLAPADQSPEDTEAFVEHFAETLGTDYRQTKGRRGSLESGRGPDDGQ